MEGRHQTANKVKTENEDEQYAKVIGKAILRKDADPNSDYKATKL